MKTWICEKKHRAHASSRINQKPRGALLPNADLLARCHEPIPKATIVVWHAAPWCASAQTGSVEGCGRTGKTNLRWGEPVTVPVGGGWTQLDGRHPSRNNLSICRATRWRWRIAVL